MAGNRKRKMSCCTVSSPSLRKISSIWWIAFDFRGNIPHLVMLHWPVYWITYKGTSFDEPKKRMVFSGYRLKCKQFGFYDLADRVVCKVPWQMRVQNTVANFHNRITAQGLMIMERSHAIFGNGYSLLEKLMLAYYWALLHALGCGGRDQLGTYWQS